MDGIVPWTRSRVLDRNLLSADETFDSCFLAHLNIYTVSTRKNLNPAVAQFYVKGTEARRTMTEYNSLTDCQQEFIEVLPTEMTLAEIGDELGISKAAAKSRKRRVDDKEGWAVEYRDGEWTYEAPNEPQTEEPENEIPTVTRSEGGGEIPSADELPQSFLNALQENGLTYNEIERQYGWSSKQAQKLFDRMSQAGWVIDFETVDAQGTRRWHIPDERDKRYQLGHGDGTYRFGLISDTHLGSEATHLADLHDFYDRLEERGVSVVLHAGDITDGWEIHQNQINEVHAEATGWNRMRDYCVQNYPKRDGIKTLFISGNHDRKLWRREGIRLGQMIDDRRDDLIWLGDSMARVVFAEDVDLELIHPSGGQPYTLGYRAQTLYREQPTDVRPTMTAIGHLHGRLWAAAEGVEAWYTGCWKDLTTYGRRKGHAAEIGGWDVEITVKDGEIDSMTSEFIRYPANDGERGSIEDLPDLTDVVGDVTEGSSLL